MPFKNQQSNKLLLEKGPVLKEVHVNLHNIRNCICGGCPSFPRKWREMLHADMPGLFCGHGKSKLEIEMKGCLCPNCLVQTEHELDGMYYCVNGKATELAIKLS